MRKANSELCKSMDAAYSHNSIITWHQSVSNSNSKGDYTALEASLDEQESDNSMVLASCVQNIKHHSIRFLYSAAETVPCLPLQQAHRITGIQTSQKEPKKRKATANTKKQHKLRSKMEDQNTYLSYCKKRSICFNIRASVFKFCFKEPQFLARDFTAAEIQYPSN